MCNNSEYSCVFVWTASRCCVGCLGKLGIITIISVVLFCVLFWCIFIHKLLHSYTHDVDKFDFKKWYKSGDVVLICRLFWIASGEYVFVFVWFCVSSGKFCFEVSFKAKSYPHIILSYPQNVDNFFIIKNFHQKSELVQKSMNLSLKSHLMQCFIAT